MTIYYTDGSCEPNPGTGGFAVIKDMQVCVLGGEHNTTNIRMEGMALIAALKDAAGQPATIYTDSEFWINVITKWSIAWEAKGWKKSGGEIKTSISLKKFAHFFAPHKPSWCGYVATITMRATN